MTLGGTLPDGTACTAGTISGAVTITGASAPVTVTGLRESGALTLENDTAGVDQAGGHLNGRVHVSDNTATAPAAITVSGVAVTAALYCTGNSLGAEPRCRGIESRHRGSRLQVHTRATLAAAASSGRWLVPRRE